MENINLAVLWDMDGTILDTLELHYLTWKEAFSDRPTLFSRQLFRANFAKYKNMPREVIEAGPQG